MNLTPDSPSMRMLSSRSPRPLSKPSIEIDRDTFEVRPLKITAVADIGKAIHPALALGQIEGGTGQGIGFATIEQVVMKNGAMANAQLTNYTIPTTLDTPDILPVPWLAAE